MTMISSRFILAGLRISMERHCLFPKSLPKVPALSFIFWAEITYPGSSHCGSALPGSGHVPTGTPTGTTWVGHGGGMSPLGKMFGLPARLGEHLLHVQKQ